MTERLGPRCADDRVGHRLPRLTLALPQIGFPSPQDSRASCTPWSVFQDGSHGSDSTPASMPGGLIDNRRPLVPTWPLQRKDARNSPRSTLGPRPQPKQGAISSQRGNTTPGHLPQRAWGPRRSSLTSPGESAQAAPPLSHNRRFPGRSREDSPERA